MQVPAVAGDVLTVRLLLAAGADATARNHDGKTALGVAADDVVAGALRAHLAKRRTEQAKKQAKQPPATKPRR